MGRAGIVRGEARCLGSQSRVAERRRRGTPSPGDDFVTFPFCCSGMSNEDIDSAVIAAQRDMFTMRIKFAKREVRRWLPRHIPAAMMACRRCMRACCC